ncbi:HNH endonuclease [bacterium]|nr:HNH endonuclease [bacterium]
MAKSNAWKKVTAKRIEEADYMCEAPGCCSRSNLYGHHFLPKGRGLVDNTYDNCIILCSGIGGCHDKAHGYLDGLGWLIFDSVKAEGRSQWEILNLLRGKKLPR